MKKAIVFLISALFSLSITNGAFAAGGISISTSSMSLEVGSSKTFTITATNTIGDVSISSSNSGVASVSAGSWSTGMIGEKQSTSGTITVTGASAGNATITLKFDAATFDEENITGQKTIAVTVTEKPAPAPTPSQNQNQNQNQKQNQNKNQNQNNNQQNQPQETPKSNNNKLKEISVDGYELEKVDDNNYTLTVPNDAEAISVNATADDSKAAVAGAGEHELEVGENTIEISITAEDGSLNKITLKVTREEQADIAPTVGPCKDETKNEPKKEEVSFLIPLIISLCFNVALAVALTILAIKTRKKDGGSSKPEPTPYIEPDTNNDTYEPESTDAPEANIDEVPVDTPAETPEFNEPPKPASINKGVDTVPKNKRTPIYSWSDVYKAKKQ
ncbi:cadherin-like beta sandwich domain-containing protein [Candidatus Saccharibacteria bacterium]|nr:cadherin-like beta sandwich domain-containing protein [Candidatus Saccharibacteria bacterium]